MIDNREKRQSVIGIHYASSVSPTSNASPDQEWRQQAGFGYSGIPAENPTPPTFEPFYAMRSNNLIGGGLV